MIYTIEKFRKKPIEIEAIKWNGNSNKQDIERFVGKKLESELENESAYLVGKGKPIFSLLIETKEGIMKAFQGDWIIKEPFPTGDRDFYPCKDEIFINTYTPIANSISKSIETKEYIFENIFNSNIQIRIKAIYYLQAWELLLTVTRNIDDYRIL